MLAAAAAEPPSTQGQRSFGSSGERAPKYARLAVGGRRRELQDITNVPAAPCQAEASSNAVSVASLLPGTKGTPSPPCNEAESTGLGGQHDVSFSDEEDAFLESDFEGFPMVGTGSSCVPGAPTPGHDQDLEDVNKLLGLDPQRSAPPTREAGRSCHGAEEEAAAAAAVLPPSWRSAAGDCGLLAPGSSGDDVEGEPPGWHLGLGEEGAVGTAAASAHPAGAGTAAAADNRSRGSEGAGAVQRLLGALRLVPEEPEGIAGTRLVELDSEDDPQDVAEYSLDIYDRLGRDEAGLEMPKPEYMEAQPELTAHMRALAVDWLVEVQVKFKLRTETLFLSVSLLDRFLATKRVRRKDLQLIVVSATFIAAKFEEIDPPDVRDFVFITKQACAKEAILAMEVAMLTTLEFCLCRPTAAHFLERYARTNRCSEAHRHLLQYILELALTDLQMARYSPSHQAAAALLVSCGLLQRRPVWPAVLARQAAAAERSIRRCVRKMCCLLEAAPSSSLQAVRRKFLRPEYSGVAALDF